MKSVRSHILLSVTLSAFLFPCLSHAQMTEAEGIDFFETKIRPVLVRECYGCHSKKTGQTRGGLQLDTKMGLLLGGDSGPSLVPGSLEDSPLWSAINYEDYSMPPNRMMAADIIEDFRVWIEMGAPDPRVQTVEPVLNVTVTAADIEKGREFWSFKRPRHSLPPETDDTEWSHGSIDNYVLAKLEENDLQPAIDADPHTLLRRLCFDLMGLPPNPEQIEWFMNKWEVDPDNAVEMTVDRLLASDRFGERWGRHWLDVVRFAESSGKEVNATFPHAWRYRDYVIDSFNDDKPYDRFVQEQIAGDLLPVQSDEQWAENLVATGFLAMGPKTLTERNPRQFRADLIDEQIDVSTRVVLGVSVACARCHDHKFDPVPQSDYYAMAGIFASTETYYGTLNNRQNRRPSDLILLPIDDAGDVGQSLTETQREALNTELESARERYRELTEIRRQARRNPDPDKADQLRQSVRQLAQVGNQMAAIQSVVNSINDDGSPKTFCMGVQRRDQPVDANLLIRGEVDQPSDTVPRGFVQVIGGNQKPIRKDSTGRLELARWMTDDNNPLTARVMANRVWQHLLGRGIVETTENFGATGLPPTHPELLDYLALRFVENDWSVKSLIREIATSRTYRMSTRFDQAGYEQDPDNKMLWRFSAKRLEAEMIRDSMLAVADKLELERPRASDVARGGTTIVRNGQIQSVRNAVVQRVLNRESDGSDGQTRRGRRSNRGNSTRGNRRGRNGNAEPAASTDPVASYRSVYLPIVRDNVPRSLSVFDFAESTMVVGTRETSNTPDQGLYFLNNERVIQWSREFANRVMKHSTDPVKQIDHAFLLAFGRPATKGEMQAARAFLDGLESDASGIAGKLEELTLLCQSIMAAAEFRIVN